MKASLLQRTWGPSEKQADSRSLCVSSDLPQDDPALQKLLLRLFLQSVHQPRPLMLRGSPISCDGLRSHTNSATEALTLGRMGSCAAGHTRSQRRAGCTNPPFRLASLGDCTPWLAATGGWLGGVMHWGPYARGQEMLAPVCCLDIRANIKHPGGSMEVQILMFWRIQWESI